MKRLFKMALLCLSCVLLLTSCSAVGEAVGKGMIALGESLVESSKGSTKVVCSLYVMNITADSAGSSTGISSAGDVSQRMMQEYMTIMLSDSVLNKVVTLAAENGVDVTASELKSMLSLTAENDSSMVKATFTSKDYTADQLVLIANAFQAVAPDYVNEIMLGIGHVDVVDAPHVVK